MTTTLNESWHYYPSDSGWGVESVSDFFGAYPASIVPLMGIGLVLIIWVTAFSLSLMSGVRKAMAVSSFITGVLATYLWKLELVQPAVILVMAVLTIIGAIGGKEENKL
jgi:hypothetical protein